MDLTAQDLQTLADMLLNLFRQERGEEPVETADPTPACQAAFDELASPNGGDPSVASLSIEDVREMVSLVAETLPPSTASAATAAVGAGPVSSAPAPSGGSSTSAEVRALADKLNELADVVENRPTQITNIDDRDTVVNTTIQQDIMTLGDVNQDFDIAVASGDGSVAAGDLNAQAIQTGDDNIAVGGSVFDSTLNSGDVEGSVTGDNTNSVVGDGSDLTQVEAENANLGSGTLTDVDGSIVDDTNFGSGDNESTDVDVLNEGGTTNVATGDANRQQAATDNSTEENLEVDASVNDSGNITDSANQTENTTVEDSFKVDESINDSANVSDSANLDESINDSQIVDDHGDQTFEAEDSFNTTEVEAEPELAD